MSREVPNCTNIIVFHFLGVMDAYRSCVPKVHFDETAKFAPIIRRFKDGILTQNNDYHILLVITHGYISDLEETREVRICNRKRHHLLINCDSAKISTKILKVIIKPSDLFEKFNN